MKDATAADTMPSMFDVSCPGCGARLVPTGSDEFTCPDCAGAYRTALGYLIEIPPGNGTD
jgi:tRNA(Ile2) C34 agmatinyltransferase TiaS